MFSDDIPPRSKFGISREQHTRRIDAYTRLIEHEGWKLFCEHVEKRRREIEEKVMSRSTPADEVPALRDIHHEMGQILRAPETERAISQRAIERVKP